MTINRIFIKYSILFIIAALTFIPLLTGCGGKTVKRAVDFKEIEETFLSKIKPEENISSYVFWHGENSEHQAITLTEKSDALVVYDAKKGTVIRRFGRTGTEKGEFKRPCDIAIADNILFVLERGNHRVQVLEVPGLTTLGFIGTDRLKKPSSLAVYRVEHGAFYLYIVDTVESKGKQIEHVLRFSVGKAVTTIHNNYLQTFGYSPEGGFLNNVESIAVDPVNKNLLLTEGDRAGKKIKVYTLDGEFTGKIIE